MEVRMSVTMSGKEWGDYPIVPEKITFARMANGGIMIDLKSQKGYPNSGKLILPREVAGPFCRALQNVLEAVEQDVLTFGKQEA